MAVPKRKKSKSRVRMCKRSHKRSVVEGVKCKNCGASYQPHRVCSACGYYNGRQVVTISAD